jgi:hypothetical protein
MMDQAYPQPLYLFGGFKNPQPGSHKAHWNVTMLKVDKNCCVEIQGNPNPMELPHL